MEFGLSSNPDKSILKLDPRTKLCLLTAISLIMVRDLFSEVTTDVSFS